MRVEKIKMFVGKNFREITFKKTGGENELVMMWSCFLWLCTLVFKKKLRENDKEDTFNISSCDNNQWANEYKVTKQIQYSQLNTIYLLQIALLLFMGDIK